MNLYDIFLEHPVVTTDSRNCPVDSIFFALKGDTYNANAFAAEALQKGCSYAVVDEAEYALDERYILVDDVLQALQALAYQHRKQMGVKIIGITGSNGKTTTKELITAVLKEKYKVHATLGNLNNHIGVPLTLLQLTHQHQLAVVEMGANHPGEIKRLCEIAQPDFGIITNVGKAHLEGFGSFEGVMQAKAELYAHIASNGMGVFINSDHGYLQQMAIQAGLPTEKEIVYSMHNHPDISMITGKIKASDPYLTMQCQTGVTFEINTRLVGSYNAENVLAAVTIGHFFGLKNTQIKQGIELFVPQNNRSQLIETNKNRLIIDAYNANPTSMEAAVLNIQQLENDNKLLILGDMLELGEHAVAEHQKIVDLIKEKGFQSVYLVGDTFKKTKQAYLTFEDVDELYAFLSEEKPENQTILIKGSRGIQLEKIISIL
jgi:UDP-N-acetylmuramoyl-tripeptide--D-alanyl-D-alanine ligase